MAQSLNTFSSVQESQSFFAADNWRAVFLPVALVIAACALGLTIALEQWLIVAAALAFLMLLVWPIEVTLGLFAFLIPFEPMTGTGSGSGPSATLLRYVGIATLILLPSVGWLRGRMVKPPRTALFWSLFMLWGAASTLWALDQEAAFGRLPTAIGLWLLYLAVVSVRITDKELSRVTLLTILGGCSAAMFAIYLFHASGSAIGRASLADGSAQADPNFFAATLLLPLSLALGEVFANRSWWRRAFNLASIGAMAAAIFLSMSRGMLAAAAVIVLVFVVRLRLNWRLLLPIAILGVALWSMPSMFYERVHDVSHDRVSGRLDIWEAGLHSLTKYWAFGAGLDNFPSAYQKFAGTARFFSGEKRVAHNIYLATSVELGLLGILALFAAVGSHLKEFSRPARSLLAPTRIIALEAACWAMLVAGLSLDILWRKAFWFVWALPIIALHVVGKNEQSLESGQAE
jgi:O-antigen ligase